MQVILLTCINILKLLNWNIWFAHIQRRSKITNNGNIFIVSKIEIMTVSLSLHVTRDHMRLSLKLIWYALYAGRYVLRNEGEWPNSLAYLKVDWDPGYVAMSRFSPLLLNDHHYVGLKMLLLLWQSFFGEVLVGIGSTLYGACNAACPEFPWGWIKFFRILYYVILSYWCKTLPIMCTRKW